MAEKRVKRKDEADKVPKGKQGKEEPKSRTNEARKGLEEKKRAD